MLKSSKHRLIWSSENQIYQLQSYGHLEQCVELENETTWLHWLATHTSFSFQGQNGRLRVVKEAQPHGEGHWYAYTTQHSIKRYLGRTAQLSLVLLEKVAKELRSEELNISDTSSTKTSSSYSSHYIAKNLSNTLSETPASLKNELGIQRAKSLQTAAFYSQPNLLLKRARLARGWTQQDVADLIEAPYAFMVTRWENGSVFPGPTYRERLCRIFGKSREELGLVKGAKAVVEIVEPPDSYNLRWPVFDPSVPLHRFLDQGLIGRDTLLKAVAQQLQSVPSKRVALQGLPGIGKTMLATSLTTADKVQKFFTDGVLWAELGPKPHLTAILNRWSTLLGLSSAQTPSLTPNDDWTHILRDAIGMRRILLVIDDAWTIEDALACMVGGPECVYLLTTRLPGVATQFANKEVFIVPELETADSVAMLIDYAPILKETAEDFLRSLSQAVGGMPLAIKLIGMHIMTQTWRHQPRRLQATLNRLQQAEERLQIAAPQAGVERDMRLPFGTPLTLQAIIELSDKALTQEEQQALYALSVFPAKPYSFSEDEALAVTTSSQNVLDRLVATGLLEVNTENRYQLHQIIADYGKSQRKKL